MKNVLVEVKSGSTVIASDTTGVSGCVTLDIGTAGTYTVTITTTGFVTRTQSRALTCGGTIGQAFLAPSSLVLTDSDRTIALTLTSPGSNIWRGCYELSESATALITQHNPGGFCDCPTVVGAGTCSIFYQLDCNITGGPGVWTLQRNWGACCWTATCAFTPPNQNVYTGGVMNPPSCSNGAPPGTADGPNTNSQSVLEFPFNINLTLHTYDGCGNGSPLSSPLGGGIVIDV